MVIFDNGCPYDHYLPSKVYLYISFMKPIIAFGDNEISALKTFFKDYPWFYYQPLNGLIEFINNTQITGFHREVNNKYISYLPENAMESIHRALMKMLKDRDDK